MIKPEKMDKTDIALWIVLVVWCVISVVVIVASTSDAHANPLIPELKPTDHAGSWTPLPSGLIIIQQGKFWVVHPATLIPCYDIKADVYLIGDKTRMVFTSAPKAELPNGQKIAPPGCYLIDTRPIGYYKVDPSNSDAFNIEYFPLEYMKEKAEKDHDDKFGK